ncbi:MAG: hypothetical protein HY562_08755 [Ignavibacteriales bacterium]|nr:hypothetical protein [Ignavibacteriales bacterium]
MKKAAILASTTLVLTSLAQVQPSPQIAEERTTVDLTVYNMNLALIREERNINLERGMNRVVVPDIPATIDGTSLHFTSKSDASGVRVLEQNFQYDLVHQAKLLAKYIGKDVEFVRLNEQNKQEYTVKGRLLATGWQQQQGGNQYYFGGQMIAAVNGKIEINPSGRLVLPSLPEGLILKPQLEWLVNATKAGRHKTEISYLANQLSWNCDYVAVLNATDTQLDLTGWVTLKNNSGTTFKNAGLKLVAGDVNIVRQPDYEAMNGLAMRSQIATPPQFAQKELFEYKLYTLQRRTDVADNETKQIELTSAKNVTTKKVFVYDGLTGSWRSWYRNYSYRDQGSFGQQSNTKVGVFLMFKNEEKARLGIPLPKGKVRVYKKDDEGKEQFIGEDQIDHTPKDEELRLYLGNAFDIVGSRVQKEFKTVVSGHVYDETFEIKVRNHKEDAVEVLVYEHPWRWSEWEITKQSTESEQVDQSTVKFPVKLKKGEEKTLTYTIRYSW